MNAPPPDPAGPAPETTGPPPRRSAFNPKMVTLLVVGAIVAGLLVARGGPVAYRWLKERQARNLTAEAAALVEKGSWDKAIKLLNQAYRKDPRNPHLLRLLAKTFDQTTGSAERSSFFWRQVVASDEATLEDRTSLGAALLREGLIDEARSILEKLPPGDRDKIPVIEFRAALLRSDQRPEEAEQLLRAAYAADSANPSSRRKLAILDLASSFPEVQDRAAATLWELSRGADSTEALKAALALASQTRPGPGQATDLRALIDRLPSITEEQRYTILGGVLRARPQDRDAILREETERHKNRPADESADFFRWLVQAGEHERVLKLLGARDATRTTGLFLSYAAALEESRRWKELRDFVRQAPALLVPGTQLGLILARCARGLGESEDVVRNHLQEAAKHAAATRDYAGLIQAGNAAERLGHNDVSIEIFDRMAAVPQLRLPALERALQIRHREGNLPAMVEIIGRCLESRPGFSVYLENLCYLKLLGGWDMEIAAHTIQGLSNAADASPATRLVQALWAYRQGDLEGARRETASVNASRLPPGQRAVLAGILHLCGQTAEAFRLAEKIPLNLLLREESRFLRHAL